MHRLVTEWGLLCKQRLASGGLLKSPFWSLSLLHVPEGSGWSPRSHWGGQGGAGPHTCLWEAL